MLLKMPTVLYMVELGERELRMKPLKRIDLAEVPVIVLINKIDQGVEDQLAESVAH
jgi:hypothetical protein